jgi:lipoyl(octanoyl) transferase
MCAHARPAHQIIMMQPARHDWSAAREASLEVFLLGLVDFEACLYLQDRLAHEVLQSAGPSGALLLCEHPAVVSVGREAGHDHVGFDRQALAARLIDVHWTNRGGGCVLHLPGQLALYAILPLDRLRLGLAEFRETLECAVLDVCQEFRVPAWRRAHQAGAWCRGGQIAEVGVAVRSHVSTFGLTLNVAPRLDVLRELGPGAERHTSLAAQRRAPVAMPQAREALIRRLAARLGYARFHLFTGHPQLARRRKVVANA